MNEPEKNAASTQEACSLHEVDMPLAKGTEIEYCGEAGTVVRDDGGRQILVQIPGEGTMWWWWRFQGVECTVTKRPIGKLCNSPEAARPPGEEGSDLR